VKTVFYFDFREPWISIGAVLFLAYVLFSWLTSWDVEFILYISVVSIVLSLMFVKENDYRKASNKKVDNKLRRFKDL